MKNWVTKPIKDVVIDLHQGLNTAGYKIKFYDTGYPIIQTRNLENGVIDLDEKMKFMSKADWLIYKDKYKPNIGDVFLTNIGTIGKTAVVTEEQDYLIHWNIFIFKVDKKIIDPYYLKTFLDTPFCFDYYQSCQKGGTVNFITKKMIEVLEIPLPPLPEQQLIVATLDEAFAAIAKAKANAEQNLKNAKELFESYLQGVFESKGDGWEEKTLGDVANTNGRIGWKGLTAKEYTEEGPLFISVHSLNYGDFVDFRDAFHISQKRYDESPEIMLKKDDILICKDGAGIGKLGILPELPDVATINSSLLLIRCKKEIITKFLYYNLLSPLFQSIVQSRLSGATTPHLYQRDIVTFPISLPSLKAQQVIVKKLDALSSETKKLEVVYNQKINDLEELKKSVLQKAFSGELKTNAFTV